MKSRHIPVFKPFSPTYGAIGGRAAATKATPPKRARRGKNGLAGPYLPISEGLNTLSPPGAGWPVVVPDSMDSETNSALRKLREALGNDVSLFVQQRLGYASHEEMAHALVAEQVDAVALAIYNIEVRGESLIIADQTGIGKGRIAAALIRYGNQQGLCPIFLSERPNLFTDIYRDLTDIGSQDLRPFIVNGREDKSNVKAGDGSILYQAPPVAVQRGLIEAVGASAGRDGAGVRVDDEQMQSSVNPSGKEWRSQPGVRQLLGGDYDCILATYSQFNRGFDWINPPKSGARGGKKVLNRSFAGLNPKCKFLATAAKGNLLILDESHNASGASNTGEFMGLVLALTRGAAFLSATFAKRPDNMVVYANKTVLREAGLSNDALVGAITRGGVALQEIISSQLVAGGQLLRRERPYAGVEVNWKTLTDEAPVHRARSDEMMAILRDVIKFQHDFVDPYLQALNDQMADAQAGKTKGTGEAGINNTPMFSRVFQMIYVMLFGIKAEAVAAHAINRLQQGKKVIITFQSTMGAFLEGLSKENEDGDEDEETGDAGEETGLAMAADTRVKATFDVVLRRVLDLSLAFSLKAANGTSARKSVDPEELGAEGRYVYAELLGRIMRVTTDVNISPIDLVTKIIKEAGFGVAEVTGRGLYLDLADNNRTGVVRRRVRENTADAFRRFNNNEVDCLLLNAAGSTGASAHAVPTPKVPASQVKQRVMIIHQPSLDINTEVQKRGRVFRTGQIMPPIYDYLVSAIPAEQRLMMMLQRKLKSLDANTTSNQKQSAKLVDAEFADFLNHHGDRIVAEYLLENLRLDQQLGNPLKNCDAQIPDDGGEPELKSVPPDFALKVTGRVAVMPTAVQAEFYQEISARYRIHLDYLNNTGQNDLEVKDLDLRAVVQDRTPVLAGQGGRSAFGGSVFREKMTVRNLTKPLSATDLLTLLRDSLAGRTAEQAQQELNYQVATYFADREKELYEGFDWEKAVEKELVKRKTPKDLRKTDPGLYQELLTLIRNDLQEGLDQDAKRLSTDRQSMLSLATRFKIGHGYKVPNPDLSAHTSSEHYLPAAFLGFTLDEKRRNPYAKSAVQLRFALASPHRALTLPISSELGKKAFYATANQYAPWNGAVTEGTWTNLISRDSADTETRYMLTDNVLLALGSPDFSVFRLPLVSFTMADGAARKGILMPREFNKLVTSSSTAAGAGRHVSQGLRTRGLTARLTEIFTEGLANGAAPQLQLRGAGGGVTLLVKAGQGYQTFALFLGWEDTQHQNEGKAFVKNLPLLRALGTQNELAKVGAYASAPDRRFWASNVPVAKLRGVLDALGESQVVIALTERLLDQYPDLLPENRSFDGDTWPSPPHLPAPRARKPTAPGPTPAPPAAPNRKLALAKAKAKALALAIAIARQREPVLAGVRGRSPKRGRIAHPQVATYL